MFLKINSAWHELIRERRDFYPLVSICTIMFFFAMTNEKPPAKWNITSPKPEVTCKQVVNSQTMSTLITPRNNLVLTLHVQTSTSTVSLTEIKIYATGRYQCLTNVNAIALIVSLIWIPYFTNTEIQNWNFAQIDFNKFKGLLSTRKGLDVSKHTIPLLWRSPMLCEQFLVLCCDLDYFHSKYTFVLSYGCIFSHCTVYTRNL